MRVTLIVLSILVIGMVSALPNDADNRIEFNYATSGNGSTTNNYYNVTGGNETTWIANYSNSYYLVKAWNDTGLIKDWNATGFIINWSAVITGGEPLWNANYSNFSTVYGYALNETLWTNNYTNYNTSWSSTTNTTYNTAYQYTTNGTFAQYNFGSNNFNGTGNFTTRGTLTGGNLVLGNQAVVPDGSIVAVGSAGNGQVLNQGQGSQLIWDARNSAFRAGLIDGGKDLWNSTNMGQTSFAVGRNVLASGQNSISVGYNSKSTAYDSISIGENNWAKEIGTIAMGITSTADGAYNIAIGYNDEALGSNGASALGYGAKAYGGYSTSIGYFSKAYAQYSSAINQGQAKGEYSTAIGATATTGRGAFAVGYNGGFDDSSFVAGNGTANVGYGQIAMGYSSPSDGIITAISPYYGGYNYQVNDLVTLHSSFMGNDDATATVTSVVDTTSIKEVSINNAGSGYQIGNQLQLYGGDNNAYVQVEKVDDVSGAVLSTSKGSNSGSGYDLGDTLTINSGNVDATVNVTSLCVGEVVNTTSQRTGSSYQVNDLLTLDGGNSDATLTVTSIDDVTGRIFDASTADQGYSYSIGDVVTVSGGNNDATINITDVSGGQVTGWEFLTRGSGYNSYNTYYTSYGGSGNSFAIYTNSVGTGNGAVLTADITTAGTGYTSGTYNALDGSGSGETFAVSVDGNLGGVCGYDLLTQGSGYSTGTNIDLSNGAGSGATINVDSVGIGGGAILNVSVYSGGTGYSVSTGHGVYGGNGYGAVFDITNLFTGYIDGISLTTGGTGYIPYYIVELNGGSGTGGEVQINSVSAPYKLRAEGTASIAMGQDVQALTNPNVIVIGRNISSDVQDSFNVGFDNIDFQVSDGDVSGWFRNNVSATGYITRTSVYDISKGDALDWIKDTSDYTSPATDKSGKLIDGAKPIINHQAFYGATAVETVDYSQPVTTTTTEKVCVEDKVIESCDYVYNKGNFVKKCINQTNTQICTPINQNVCDYVETTAGKYVQKCHMESNLDSCKCSMETVNKVTYPYNKTEQGVDLGKEIDVLRQGTYELKTIKDDQQSSIDNLNSQITALQDNKKCSDDCLVNSKEFIDYKDCVLKCNDNIGGIGGGGIMNPPVKVG